MKKGLISYLVHYAQRCKSLLLQKCTKDIFPLNTLKFRFMPKIVDSIECTLLELSGIILSWYYRWLCSEVKITIKIFHISEVS